MSNEEMLPTTVFKEEEDPLDIELKGPHPSGAQVHLSPEGVLIWPVMLMFPEFGETDFIEAFRENDRYCTLCLLLSLLYIHVAAAHCVYC